MFKALSALRVIQFRCTYRQFHNTVSTFAIMLSFPKNFVQITTRSISCQIFYNFISYQMIFYLLTVFLRYEEQSLYTRQELLYDANAKESHSSLNYNDIYIFTLNILLIQCLQKICFNVINHDHLCHNFFQVFHITQEYTSVTFQNRFIA